MERGERKVHRPTNRLQLSVGAVRVPSSRVTAFPTSHVCRVRLARDETTPIFYSQHAGDLIERAKKPRGTRLASDGSETPRTLDRS